MPRPPEVARVLERVTATVRRHSLLAPGETVIVACSGGPDSVCLLYALYELRRLLKLRLAVFHFDHRMHPGSERHATYVRGLASRLGARFELRVAEDRPAKGESPEAWARLARYAALAQVADEAGAGTAAVGHTLDDQAETVLLGLARGGGIEAAAGMAPVSALPPLGVRGVRPLMEVRRSETEAFCRALKLRPRRDPTNRDRRYLRNRVRHEVLPVLERVLDRNLAVTLARTAEHVRADADHLEALASEAAREVVRVDPEEVSLDPEALLRLPGPIAARVARQALRAAGSVEGAPEATAAHVEAVLDLAAGRPGRRADLPGPLLAVRDKGYVRVSRASPAQDDDPSRRRARREMRRSG